MRVHVADHPLITHKLTVLRDASTPSPTFRALTAELVTLLAYEATRGVRTHEVQITTPVTTTTGLDIFDKQAGCGLGSLTYPLDNVVFALQSSDYQNTDRGLPSLTLVEIAV